MSFYTNIYFLTRSLPYALASMAVVSLSAVPSFACDPDPNFPYDDIGSVDISIIVATVSNVEMVTNETSCWVLSYDYAEYLYGSGSSEFL